MTYVTLNVFSELPGIHMDVRIPVDQKKEGEQGECHDEGRIEECCRN